MARNTTENTDKNFGISMEVVTVEPLSEEEMDQLALLFAKAIVRKMLRKGSADVRKKTANNKSDNS